MSKSSNRTLLFLKEHGVSIFLGLAVVILLVSPDAKAWAIRQLMKTGVFNAKIEEVAPADKLVHDFSFSDPDGNIVSTNQLRGKVLFINFWASWCPPCRAEFPSIEALYQKFKDHPDVVFIMINQDDEAVAGKSYLDKEGFTFPMHRLHGPLANEIYTGSLPTTLVMDKAGSIRFKHEGFANYGSTKFIAQLEELLNKN
ncbi:TlpA family protein disulfide reductase [Sphingobacterium hotanense]|uniref:TlpA family protein disulfide reductase n=1 Tax=Sphingobacterium hotanense TaxID=649196 RepID=UPI0021A58B59|nr:TlpA disulfide reductase family protein [Sphingobacterium hotanense]MCT1524799.1 TlpA family protein disulfide reductase [Sphingobacterium hotanense]